VSLHEVWRPWSAAWLSRPPDFLIEATRKDKAERLLTPLGVSSIPEFRSKLKDAIDALHQLFGNRNPFYDAFGGLSPEMIGTK
jgi:hypothetical protein